MAKLVWGASGDKRYETGVDHGVLYVKDSTANEGNGYSKGVAWNGLTAVTESPSGAEATAIFADNVKYLSLVSAEEFGATIEAYTYPDEFAKCDGSASLGEGVNIGQQSRTTFGFTYRTKIGDDENNDAAGYKIHIIYNCLAAPSEKAYASVNDSPEAITLSWEVTTTPVPVTGFKPTASLTIDSTKIDSVKLTSIEAKLYGTTTDEPSILLPDEIKAILDAHS